MAMLHTMQAGYQKIRSDFVSSDDSALDGVTSALTYKSTDRPVNECFVAGPEVGGIGVIFIGNGADDTTFGFKLYCYRTVAENGVGPAEFICSGTGILGTALSEVGTRYADTVVITNAGNWLDVPVAIDSGNNRICKVCFDLCGYRYLYVEFSGVGGAGEATSMQSYVAFF